jgi:hypothetical protein
LLAFVVLQNLSVQRWVALQSAAGVPCATKPVMPQLVVALNLLEAHFSSEVDQMVASAAA